MSKITIIAGPPGIGKTVMGEGYIDPELIILNEDELRFRYKEKGYPDYNEFSIQRVSDIIRQHLISNRDFALELNLGFQHQYDYILSCKKFRHENQLNVILFFTDELELCLRRAKARHESGRHLVLPSTIIQMYNNTIPLLKHHFDFIDQLMLINAGSDNMFFRVAAFDRTLWELDLFDTGPDWFKNDLSLFFDRYFGLDNSHNNLLLLI